jgi:nuclear-control-of-ATPase protein 2
MAASPPPRSPSSGDPAEAADLAASAAAALASPARVWSSLLARLPSLSDYSRLLSVGRGRGRRRRRAALPLPIRPAAAHSARIAGQMPKAFDILQDVAQHTLSNLHDIQKSLIFWQSKAEGTSSQKLYFMIFERGPRAFVEAAWQTLTRLKSNGSPVPHLLHSASDMVSTKLAVLTSMQHCLAAFLAEVCLIKCDYQYQMLMSSRINCSLQ